MKDGMIIKGNWENFLNVFGEELLLVKRQHIFMCVYPTLLTLIFFFGFSAASYFFFDMLFHSLPLFIVTTLLFFNIALNVMIFSFVRWYFHFYILTSKKILEVRFSPLSSHVVNDIFLDKVNCTEVDLSSKGFFHELIDMGDITITFDRPTHQEEFTFQNIKNCDALGKFLSQKLLESKRDRIDETLWFRRRNGLFPRVTV